MLISLSVYEGMAYGNWPRHWSGEYIGLESRSPADYGHEQDTPVSHEAGKYQVYIRGNNQS
jgi:hypothetical protein